jgi:SPFH domain / Band 7 family
VGTELRSRAGTILDSLIISRVAGGRVMKSPVLLCAVFGLFTIPLLTGCSVASPDAGHQAVWVDKPLIFGHGGVDPVPVTTGRSYSWITSEGIDVNMQPQRVDMEFDDMMTSSGVPVSFHVVAQFKVIDAVKLVSAFGADRDREGNWGFWDRNMDQPLRTAVRDSVKRRDMQEMAISQTAADAVGNEISTAAIQLVKNLGLPIVFTTINVGRVNPPDAIKNQRIETAAQEQRAITMQQTKLAEDQRKMAEQSRASADNAYREAMQLSPDQFLQLERIKMQRDVCEHAACTFFIGGGPVPTVDAGKR